MKDVGGTVLAGSTPPFLGRERAAVNVDVGPERRSPRYHETYLALESVEESSAAVSEPRCVWLRVPIFKDLEQARRLPVRVEKQQAQQLAMNPPRSGAKNRSLAGNEQPSTSVDNESERGCRGCSGDDGDRRGDAAAAHPEPAPPRGQRRVLFSRRVKIRRHVAELSAPRRGHHDVAQRRRV